MDFLGIMRRCAMLARILAVCLIVVSPAVAQKKPKKPQPKRLVAAVKKVNRMLSLVPNPGRKRVDDSGRLDGIFRFSIAIDRIVEDGAMTIDAGLTVDRGPMHRYKNDQERFALEGLADGLRDLRTQKKAAMDEYAEKHIPPNRCLHAATSRRHRVGMKCADRHGKLRVVVTEATMQSSLRRIQRKYDRLIRDEQAEVSKFAGPINARLAAEKEKYDTVEVVLSISKRLAAKIDMGKLAARKKVGFVGRVGSYELEDEPVEAGGQMRVSRLTVTVTGIHKSIRK